MLDRSNTICNELGKVLAVFALAPRKIGQVTIEVLCNTNAKST